MIRHLLKLVWHRKRSNALVLAEIFVSFLIVFVVVTMAVSLVSRWSTPLGFDWHDVWVVNLNQTVPREHNAMHAGSGPPTPGEKELQDRQDRADATKQLIREVRAMPEVEAASGSAMPPYSEHTWQTAIPGATGSVFVTADKAEDDYARVMRLKLLSGRWFSKEDDAKNYRPLVIDADAARAVFGTVDAVGKKFDSDKFYGAETGMQEFRVVGVMAPYRKDGELSDNDIRMIFYREDFVRPIEPMVNSLVIRTRPGTPASFEADLNNRLRRLGVVSFEIKRMEAMRRIDLKIRFAPVAILSVIALFLISMVALGLTGVMWQTITRRMREIGVRRAVGASGAGVRSQVLGEVAVLCTLSVVVGIVIIVQLPLLGAFRIVTPAEFGAGVAAAIIVIYSITLLCGAYPSWMASTVEPADALRYE